MCVFHSQLSPDPAQTKPRPGPARPKPMSGAPSPRVPAPRSPCPRAVPPPAFMLPTLSACPFRFAAAHFFRCDAAASTCAPSSKI